MSKYTFLLYFIIVFYLSNEIEEKDYDKYFNYTIIILKGMAKTNDTNDTKCADFLEENKDKLKIIAMEIISLVEKGETIAEAIGSYFWELLFFLNEDCNPNRLLELYSELVELEDIRNKTLINLGKAVKGIIDFSVD